MTYVPHDRDDDVILDQTQRLDTTPAPAFPAVGNGVDAQSAQPVDPFAGRPAVTVGYAESPAAPRDRTVFQFVWEAILLLLTLNALFLVYQRQDEIFGGDATMDALNGQFAALTPLLLTAVGFGLTLRLGAVNLAVPAMPMLVLAVPSLFVGTNPLVGLAYTAGAAAVVAIVFTVLTVVFRLPAWLAGLASLVLLAGSFAGLLELAELLDATGQPGTWSNPGSLWLFLGAAALSIAGGLLGLVPAVRDRFSKVRGATDGTGDREAASVFALLGGTFLALLLAALGGFAAVVFSGADGTGFAGVPGMFVLGGDASLTLVPLVLIVVFLAGTSPWGRRGPVFGTVLAAVAVWSLDLVWGSLAEDQFQQWTGAVYAGLLLLGLFVSFGLDRLGRPKEPVEDDDTGATTELPSNYDPADPGTGLFDPSLQDPAAANR
ncbi:hypothetical protein [Glycomyces sp. NPDC047010]|uniref:hypothetical protein n=1 Tax=Glycomyces sp. NPDC047010 TaxID=3155023 RepID=UPI0033EAF0D4